MLYAQTRFLMVKKLFIILIVILLSCYSARSASDTLQVLSLQSAIELSLRENPSLNRLRASRDEVQNMWKKEANMSNPEVFYYQNGIGDNDLYFEQAVGVSQQIGSPFKVLRLKQVRNIELEILETQIHLREIELVAMVKKAYVDLLYRVYKNKLLENRIKVFSDLKSAIQLKYENGTADYLDQLSASVALEEAKNKLRFSNSEYHKARYNLFEIVGIDPEDQRYSISFADSLETYERYFDQERVIDSLDYYPGVQVEKLKYNAEQQRYRSAKADWFPNLSMSYLRQDFSTGYQFNGFEIGVEIPLWASYTISPDVKIQASKMEQQNWSVDETILKYKKEIEHAWHAYEMAREVVVNYQDTLSLQTSELLELSREAYMLGQIDLINLLKAESMDLDNQEVYLSALKDYYLSLVELEKYTKQKLVY